MDETQGDMATAIFDIAHHCLDCFDRVVENHDKSFLTHSLNPGDGTTASTTQRLSSFDFLGLRNSFLFWIDYTGALSSMDSSLDERLRGLTDISATVIELLEMILRNLHRIDCKPEGLSIPSRDTTTSYSGAQQNFLTRWEDASRGVDSALNRLHIVAVEIRKASAKQLDHTVTTILTDQDFAFRRDIASLVRYRFPAARKGLCQQLGDSIAARRRMLLQTKRHARRLAVRRATKTVGLANQSKDDHLKPSQAIVKHGKDRRSSHPAVATGLTKASRPDPEAPAIKLLQLPSRRAITTVMSTISTTQQDSFDYPPPPTAREGESRVQCPFCLMALERKSSEKEKNDNWKRHVDQDIKPYACLFSECADSLVFFVHRHEWKAHMESAHAKDWLRKAHTMRWYCDLDHDPPVTFETELQWREHMLDPNSHPKKRSVPTPVQLDALSPRRQQIAIRDRFVCPLCEQIPEEIRQKVAKGKGDSTQMYNFVVDHVANHMKSLSLMAVPSLDNSAQETANMNKESVVFTKDSFRRFLNADSIPQPPSGREHMKDASLPPEPWSYLDRNEIVSLTVPYHKEWDKDFLDYTQAETPPEPSEEDWLEQWKSWKLEHDAALYQSPEKDPVLVHLSRLKASEFDINSQEIAGRTELSFAAQSGDVDTIERLLTMGADIGLADQDGQTPLLWAAYKGHEATVRLLLEYGARVETVDQIYGRTPLSWAVMRDHESVVRLFLEHGVEVDAVDNSCRTPLSWAAEEGFAVMTQLLLEKGANIEALDPEDQQTPLSLAAEKGHEEVVRVLFENGANLEAADSQGLTSLSWATNNGHDEVAHLLRSFDAQSRSVS